MAIDSLPLLKHEHPARAQTIETAVTSCFARAPAITALLRRLQHRHEGFAFANRTERLHLISQRILASAIWKASSLRASFLFPWQLAQGPGQ
jgi:hypothetical protein